MQELEQLESQWNDTVRFRSKNATLHLDAEGLKLGAGTVVAKRNHDGSLALDGEEERVLTLLSVAYGQALDSSVLKSIRRVSDHARNGDERMAGMGVALAKLPRIFEPEDAARRLFIADGLIAAGVKPRDIWKTLEFDAALLDTLEKYSPDEPRVPAGSGKPSGQWTSGGTSDGGTSAETAIATAAAAASPVVARVGRAAAQTASEQLPKVLARLPSVVARIAEFARLLNLPIMVAQEVLQPSGTGGSVISGKVRGRSDLYFLRHQDELALNLIDKSTGHTIATLYPTGVRGRYVDHETGIVAQMAGDELVIRAATEATSQAEARRDRPRLCQDPIGPDNSGLTGPRGERSKAYEAIMRERTNPEEPTPPGKAYWLTDPETGEPVKIDDCELSTGDLMENKGPGYEEKVGPEAHPAVKNGVTKDLLDQATRQARASAGRHLVWNFAELGALEYARTLFQDDPLLAGIELRYEPWPEGERWKWSRTKNRWLRLIRGLDLRKRLMSLQQQLRLLDRAILTASLARSVR